MIVDDRDDGGAADAVWSSRSGMRGGRGKLWDT
jgi:hypothetical protein